MRKKMSFTKGFKKLLNEGGMLINSEVGADSNKVIFIHENMHMKSGILKEDNTIGSKKNFVVDTRVHNEDKVWEHHEMPERKVNIFSLELPLPIPQTNSELMTVFNTQMNYLCGVGYKATLENLHKIYMHEGGAISVHDQKLAMVLKLFIECNIMSYIATKQATSTERRFVYEERSKKAEQLIHKCLGYGISVMWEKKPSMPNNLVYFGFSECEQVSLCIPISDELKDKLPIFQGDWDEKRASNLPKVEKAIYKTGLIDYFK